MTGSGRFRRPLLGGLALVALTLALLPAAATAAPSMRWGFSDTWEAHPAGLTPMAGLGATAARMYVCWCDVEPTPVTWNLTGYDTAYNLMLARGVRPVLVVLGSPRWARAGVTDRGRLTVPARAYDAQWQALFAELARRYPNALGLEVWNEPNMAEFFPPQADTGRYTELLRRAHDGVRSVSSGMPVVLGAPAGTDTTGAGPNGLSDEDFLAGVYEHGGRPYFDAIGAHPYPGYGPVVGSLRLKLDRLRAVRDAHGDAGKPLWVTETGVSTGTDGGHPSFTEDQQADALARMWKALYAMNDVPVALINRWYDLGTGFSEWDRGMGVVRLDGSLKPSARALADARDDPAEARVSVALTPSSPAAERNQIVTWTASGWEGVGPVTYAWDLNGNGDYELQTGSVSTAKLRYTQPGSFTVSVRVSDFFESYVVRVPFTVAAARPPVARMNLRANARYQLGASVAFDGTRSYDVDSSGSIVWWGWDIRRVDAKGRAVGSNNHYVGRSFAKALTLPGRYRVRLTVRDNTQTQSAATQVYITVLAPAHTKVRPSSRRARPRARRR